MNTVDRSRAESGYGISVIIPVYNAQAYLQKCLDSVTRQSFEQLEVICVDDASTDGSVQVIEQAMSLDPRIKLHRQSENSGAPAARNIGIRSAAGKYMIFVDADDRLVDNALDQLFQLAESCGSDAVKGLMYLESGPHKLKRHGLNQTRAWTDTRLAECTEIQHLYQYQSYLFRSSVLCEAGLQFDLSLKNFQDPVFLAFLLPVCKRIDVCTDPVYVRTVTPDSIITSTWCVDNYMSLVHGTHRAYENLVAAGQNGAAALMAQTFSNWWYKFQLMPGSMDSLACAEIFEHMQQFLKLCEHPVEVHRWRKAGACHCLMLIARGDFPDCYKQLGRRYQLQRFLPEPLLRIYDLANYLFAAVFRRI